jgi:hypothetical protein
VLPFGALDQTQAKAWLRNKSCVVFRMLNAFFKVRLPISFGIYTINDMPTTQGVDAAIKSCLFMPVP